MKSLIVRNLKVFFRDRASVFFSLLSVFIIFVLYVLFLGDVWTNELPKVPGREGADGQLDHGGHPRGDEHDHRDGRVRHYGG